MEGRVRGIEGHPDKPRIVALSVDELDRFVHLIGGAVGCGVGGLDPIFHLGPVLIVLHAPAENSGELLPAAGVGGSGHSAAEVPLPEAAGGVGRVFLSEDFGESELASRQSEIALRASHPVAEGMSAGDDGGSRRGAHRLGEGIDESHSAVGETLQRWHVGDHAAGIVEGTGIDPPVIHNEKEDIVAAGRSRDGEEVDGVIQNRPLCSSRSKSIPGVRPRSPLYS